MNPASKKTEILVGLFVLFSLVLLAGLVWRFSDFAEERRPTDTYIVRFENAGGLTEGAPVALGGTKIGRIQSAPRLDDQGKVIIPIEIFRDAKHRLPKNIRVAIGRSGLLGDSYVSIEMPAQPAADFYQPGDQIDGTRSAGLDQLQEAANNISQRTMVLLEDVQTGLRDLNGAIGKLDKNVLSEENLGHFRESLDRINKTVGKIDQTVLSQQNTDNLSTTLTRLRETSEALARQSTKLDSIMTKGDQAMTKLSSAADTFKQSGTAFTQAAEKAGATFGGMNGGQGLMNALIHDAQLRTDFKNLIANLKERGVLFYKDKSDERPVSPAPSPTPRPTERRR
jgi:phospholipid/cholesterol/gamma-HCH transport system substrate-binding protein